MKNILIRILVVVSLALASSSFAKTKYWLYENETVEQYIDLINNGEVIDISELTDLYYKAVIKHPDYGLMYCVVGAKLWCNQAGNPPSENLRKKWEELKEKLDKIEDRRR